jgi:uncharacterized protein (DUF58 family)
VKAAGVLAALALLFVPYAPIQWASAFVLLTVGASWLYAETLRLNVEVGRLDPTIRMFRHEDAAVRLGVRNTGFLPAPLLLVSDSTGELYTRDDDAFVLSLAARSRRVLSYRVRAHYRGVYSLGPIRMRTSDPLGLFPIVREVSAPGTIIVYPRHEPRALPRKLGVPVGGVRVETPIAADTTRYRSLRDYVPGDDTRHIGWKATARHGSLKTREFTPTIEAPVCIFLNLRAADFADRHMVLAVERSVETAASLVMAAARGRRSFRLVAHAELGGVAHYEMRGAGAASALSALELLARATALYDAETATEALVAAASGSRAERILYVGPVLPETELDHLLSAGIRPTGIELYYVQELTRRSVLHTAHGLPVHPVRLYGVNDGDTPA